MIRRHYLVSGRVQGVGFRYFVYGKAKELGIVGYVRNLGDGRVEILAFGPETALHELEAAIATGPTFSRVTGCERKDLSANVRLPQGLKSGSEFSIVADGEDPWEFEC